MARLNTQTELKNHEEGIRNLYTRVMQNPNMSKEDARIFVRHYYRFTYAPLSHYTIDQWIEMFAKGGETAGKPDHLRPITVYRGCFPKYREGMSWTPNLQVAEHYAHRYGGKHIYILELTVPEVITHYPPTQSPLTPEEIVVDARGRVIELLDPSKHTVCLDPLTKDVFHRNKRPGDKPWCYRAEEHEELLKIGQLETREVNHPVFQSKGSGHV